MEIYLYGINMYLNKYKLNLHDHKIIVLTFVFIDEPCSAGPIISLKNK